MQDNKWQQYGEFFKNKHGEDFYNQHLLAFINAQDEQARIALISDDPNVQKMQLQMAISVSDPQTDRMGRGHDAPELTLQETLINLLCKDKDPANMLYLSSMLRDYVVRPCDTGQVPAPYADKTIKLFIDAGVNPHIDYLDPEYDSPGFNHTGQYSGRTLPELLGIWLQHGPDLHNHSRLKAMQEALLKSKLTPQTTSNTPEQLFQILVTTGGRLRLIQLPTSTLGSDHQKIRIKAGQKIADQLLRSGITIENLPDLVLRVQKQLEDKVNYRKNDPKSYNLFANNLRRATALVMEAIYKKEHMRELQYLQVIKICLILTPLIIPLFAAAILAIIRAVIMHNTKYSVTAENLSLSTFSASLPETVQKIVNNNNVGQAYEQAKTQPSPQLPITEQGDRTTIKEAVLINPSSKANRQKMNILRSVFNGNSSILPNERARLKNDIRVYKPVLGS